MSLFRSLNPNHIPPYIKPEDEIAVLRERAIQFSFLGISFFATIAFLAAFILAIQQHTLGFLGLYFLLFILILTLTLARNLSYQERASGMLFLLLIGGVFALITSGLKAEALILLMILPILGTILVGRRTGLVFVALSVISVMVVGFLAFTGQALSPTAVQNSPKSVLDLLLTIGLFTILSILATGALASIIAGFELIFHKRNQLNEELNQAQLTFQNHEKEHEKKLKEQSDSMEAASRIAITISDLNEVDRLLQKVVDSISIEFNYYFAGVFLLDESKENAVYRSGTGEGGDYYQQHDKKVSLNSENPIRRSIQSGEIRYVQFPKNNSGEFSNPHLVQSRSEMILPLIYENKVIGALDIHNQRSETFATEEIIRLRLIADQLAVSIHKASLIEGMQTQIAELEAGYRQITQKTWRSYLKSTQQRYSIRYKQTVLENDAPDSPEDKEALQSGRLVVKIHDEPTVEKPITIVAIPIRFRNQAVGVINVRIESRGVTQDMLKVLEASSDRLALALENARLVDELQLRAQQEHLISEIGSKVRSSPDIDTILRTATVEIGQSFGTSDVMIHLVASESS